MGPRGNDSILLSPGIFQGILPNIPNFQAGYLYSFGDGVESGRLSLDLVQPVMVGNSSAFFGEFHNEWQNFWKTVTRGANHRVDLSVGGGYRTIFNDNTLVGVNAFFDSSRLWGTWYNSGGLGAEFAARLPGNDALDLTFNWYGNMFKSNVLANVFRRGPENYDFQAGYSHELWNRGPDLRLSVTGYRFSEGSGVYGYRGGAELKSRNGMLLVKYEAAHDRVNETYHTVGGFVNVGLQLENLLAGESPFVLPEPIFKSPRNLGRELTLPVKRDFSNQAYAWRGHGEGDSDGFDCPKCAQNNCNIAQGEVIIRQGFGLFPSAMDDSSPCCYPINYISGGTPTDQVNLYFSRQGTNELLEITWYSDSNCSQRLGDWGINPGDNCYDTITTFSSASDWPRSFAIKNVGSGISVSAGCVSVTITITP